MEIIQMSHSPTVLSPPEIYQYNLFSVVFFHRDRPILIYSSGSVSKRKNKSAKFKMNRSWPVIHQAHLTTYVSDVTFDCICLLHCAIAQASMQHSIWIHRVGRVRLLQSNLYCCFGASYNTELQHLCSFHMYTFIFRNISSFSKMAHWIRKNGTVNKGKKTWKGHRPVQEHQFCV